MNNTTIKEVVTTRYEKYNCEFCGKEFERTITKGRKKRFCDRKCGDKAKAKRYKSKFSLVCKECKSIFTSNNKNAQFCSVSCQAIYNGNRLRNQECSHCGTAFFGKKGNKYCDNCKYETRKCQECNQDFKVKRQSSYKRVFCSSYCRSLSSSKYVSICKNCGNKFVGKSNRMNKFCSRKCFYEKLGYEEYDVKRTNHLSDASSIKRAIEYGVEYEKIDILKVFERDKWTCGICGGNVDSTLVYPDSKSASLDHIIPLSKGGTHTYDNVQCAHLGCNIKKFNSIEE